MGSGHRGEISHSPATREFPGAPISTTVGSGFAI